MSKAVSALGGARFAGTVEVREVGPQGMITLRGDLSSAKVKSAVKSAVGVAVPAQRRVTIEAGRGAGWMSPDELLLWLPYDEVAATLATLGKALAGQHALAVDVSDARAVFEVEGARSAEVLAKLCPVDFATLQPGELRRSRTAQVAAALWQSAPDTYTVVAFRSR